MMEDIIKEYLTAPDDDLNAIGVELVKCLKKGRMQYLQFAYNSPLVSGKCFHHLREYLENKGKISVLIYDKEKYSNINTSRVFITRSRYYKYGMTINGMKMYKIV